MIQPGDRLPSVPVKLIDKQGAADVDSAEALGSGLVVYFSVPGAFTPTCHTNHLPGYLDRADELRAEGVDRIVCGSVNDHHVMKAWAEASGALGDITFLADGNAAFTRALGFDQDLSGGGMGTRSIRAAMIIRDGVVENVFVEEQRGQVTSSGAPAILTALGERVE